MPQGLELHVLVAQSFSAMRKADPSITIVKSTSKGTGQRTLRGAEVGFSVEIRVLGGGVGHRHDFCLLGKGPTSSCARAGDGG